MREIDTSTPKEDGQVQEDLWNEHDSTPEARTSTKPRKVPCSCAEAYVENGGYIGETNQRACFQCRLERGHSGKSCSRCKGKYIVVVERIFTIRERNTDDDDDG